MATRLVIEWTRATLRLAVAEGRAKHFRLRAVSTQPIAAAEEAVEVLRTLLKATKMASPEVIGVIPREQVITRVVKFPSVDLKEIAQMVDLYAKAQMPYPKEQTVMDFYVISKQAGFSTVAVVACQRDAIDRTLKLLRGANLTVDLLTLSSWGLAGWYRQLKHPQPLREPVLIVNVDDARTDFVFVANGRILSSRSIGQGAQDWQEGAETIELLAQEIERSRASIRKELPDADARGILLTGISAASSWAEALSERAALTVTWTDPRQAFPGCLMPPVPAISPVVAGGIAISDRHQLLNLSPTEMRAQVTQRRHVQEFSLIGMLLVGVFVLGAGVMGVRVAREHALALQLNQAIADIHPSAKQVQERIHSTQMVNAVFDDRKHLARTIADIFTATPQTVTLEGLSFEGTRREITLRGSATTDQEALSFVTQLQQLQGIKEVFLKYSTRRATPGGEKTDFELVLIQKKEKTVFHG